MSNTSTGDIAPAGTGTAGGADSRAALLAELRAHVGRRYGTVHAWDAVNEPMIRQWCEALDFDFPAFTDPLAAARGVHGGIVAPASMLPVWLMPGLRNQRPPGSDTANNREIMGVLERHGYTGILGTNCEQEYERPLRPGERISCTHQTEAVSDLKQTRLGPGFFVTFLQEFHDAAGALVGTMRLRILRYRPEAKAAVSATTETPAATNPPAAPHSPPQRAPRPQPVASPDTAFFWEGLQRGELLIQRCDACGTLRHPPGPACMQCHSLAWRPVRASGRGRIASFVVMHKPQVSGFDYPHPVGLIELDEGVRLIAPLAGRPERDYAIGMRVAAVLEPVAGEQRLPTFHVVAAASDGNQANHASDA